jgi:tripartite ATP-independent transporter DctM subunit
MLYAIAIFITVKIDPASAPIYTVPPIGWGQRLCIIATELVPLGLVIFAVIGTIIIGLATPSESAAFGVLAVVILMFIYRCFSWKLLVKALDSALRVSVMVFIIIVGSSTFSQILAYAGATSALVEWATSFELNKYMLLAVMFLVLIVLGMFVDVISIMLLTVPIFFPIIQQIGFDAVLFGVIMMISLEIGAITPPFGLLLFVMKGILGPRATVHEIVMASLPYLGCGVLTVVLLILFPDIALYLPRMAMK